MPVGRGAIIFPIRRMEARPALWTITAKEILVARLTSIEYVYGPLIAIQPVDSYRYCLGQRRWVAIDPTDPAGSFASRDRSISAGTVCNCWGCEDEGE